jgi:hypothetical protein
VIDLQRLLVFAFAAQLTTPACNVQDFVSDAQRHRVGFDQAVVPSRQTSTDEELSEAAVAAHLEIGSFFEGETTIDVQANNIGVTSYDAATAQHGQWHALDSILVEEQLALVGKHEADGDLSDGGCTADVEQRSDEERLIDVAHPHLVVDEVAELLVRHGGTRYCACRFAGASSRPPMD